MKLRICDKEFESSEIRQLYPAALVKTGYEDEVTQASLEWLETEAKGRVEVAGYAIFVHMKDDEKHRFVFDSREAMDAEAARIAAQFRR